MKNFKNLFLVALTLGSLTLTNGCLHILEEVTVRDNGKGSYKMTIDMSEMKGMMDMLKTMAPDSTATETNEATGADGAGDISQIGAEMSSVAAALKGLEGISNVVEINDTATFKFGYSFDFKDLKALNNALHMAGKDKYADNPMEVYKGDGKSFERLAVADLSKELTAAMGSGEEEDQESMDMMKMFLADMSYKQVYNFPDREIKKSSNELAEISEDKHTCTLTLKPFDESMKDKKMSVANVLKLK